jgi:hypothetical protein
VHEFIGVDPDWLPPVDVGEFNTFDGRKAPGRLMRAARQVPGARRLRRLAPVPVMAAERLLWSTRRRIDVGSAVLSPDLRERLAAELAPDLARLRTHMGADYPDWQLP